MYFYRILIGILSTLIAMMSNFMSGPVLNEQKKAENFEPVLRFAVCSDTHINGKEDYKLDRINDLFSFAYSVAEQDEAYNKLDAVAFAGDLTDSGTDEQFTAFDNTVKSAKKDETKILAVVAKAHDSSQSRKTSTDYCKQITGNDSDFHIIINGYHFIGVSTNSNGGTNYSTSQLVWVEKQLQQAVEDDENKPVFVFTHEHVKNTVYGSTAFDGWGINTFKSIFSRYPQIVHFSGHSHYPLNDPRSIYQNMFTEVGTGSMYYMEFTVDSDRTVHPDNNITSQNWIIEVDKNNQVRLRGVDLVNKEFLCDYLLEDVSDRKSFAYTEENQIACSSAPEFDENAEITVEKNDKYTLTVPAAKSTDEKPVFLYRVYVYNNLGTQIHTEYYVNDYWFLNSYESISFTVNAKEGYSAKIVAENAYGMQSEPLTINF